MRYEIFLLFCSYLNGEKVELRSVVTAVETLHAAEKYLCHGLLKDCVQYLASQLTIDNVLPILRRTRLYTPADDPTPRPSAPPLDESSAMAVSVDNTEDQVRRLQQQQQRAGLCSYLLDQCLEFIDTNASGVLASEVRFYCQTESKSTTITPIRDGANNVLRWFLVLPAQCNRLKHSSSNVYWSAICRLDRLLLDLLLKKKFEIRDLPNVGKNLKLIVIQRT